MFLSLSQINKNMSSGEDWKKKLKTLKRKDSVLALHRRSTLVPFPSPIGVHPLNYKEPHETCNQGALGSGSSSQTYPDLVSKASFLSLPSELISFL